MSKFLRPKYSFTLSVTEPQERGKAVEQALQTLIVNCNADEILLLARASDNPIIKHAAIEQLKNLL